MGVRTGLYDSVAWRKSSYSADQNTCVEITATGAFVLVRDSQDRYGPRFVLTLAQWGELMRRIRCGDLERG